MTPFSKKVTWRLKMSRAFVREQEEGDPRCPGCNALGDSVGRPTMEAHLPATTLPIWVDAAHYCVNSGCPIAYFSPWGSSVASEHLTRTAYPKDPAGPLCSCFGITAEEVIEDALAGRKERVRDLMERSKGPEARCIERSPDGLCCLPRVLRLFRDSFEPR